MNFIVVGGSGFIGRQCVELMLGSGHRVTVVTRSTEHVRPGAAHVAGGIAALCARPDLLEAADAVCHMASSTIPASSSTDPFSDIDDNLRPMIQLLEAMRQHGNRRMLYLSSGGAIYGIPESVPISEEHPKAPLSPYGIVKLTIEMYLEHYARLHSFSPAIIRPANPYGSGQGKVGQLGAVWTFLSMIRKGQRATLWGDGSAVRDFVHVEDLGRLVLAVLEQKAEGAYNCGGGHGGTSLRELISVLEKATGRRLEVELQPARSFDPPVVLLDISKARRELGWSPQISLEDGISLLLAADQ